MSETERGIAISIPGGKCKRTGKNWWFDFQETRRELKKKNEFISWYNLHK